MAVVLIPGEYYVPCYTGRSHSALLQTGVLKKKNQCYIILIVFKMDGL